MNISTEENKNEFLTLLNVLHLTHKIYGTVQSLWIGFIHLLAKEKYQKL